MNTSAANSHEERSASRLCALQALYQLEMTGNAPQDVVEEFIEHRFGRNPDTGAPIHDEAFFSDVVHGVLKHQVEIDRSIARSLAAGWTLGRIDSILRALLRAASYELLARRDDPADLIAKKALRVNLSDLAAKGARARNYLLALSLPDWVDDSWLRRFAAGLEEDQTNYAVSLLGGDTTSTPGPLTLSITALGSIAAGTMLRRRGARPGDVVFVSGTIGDAGAGLEILRGKGSQLSAEARENLILRYRVPE